jgi:dephospho-CoA kinase
MRIALVGHPSSGKDTTAAYMVEAYGYRHISTSDLIRFYVAEHDMGEPTRELLHEVANFLRAEHGPDYFARLALQQPDERMIISGLRNPAELKIIQQMQGIGVAVRASLELRYQRAKERGRVGEDITLEDFREIEASEAVNPNPDAQNVEAVLQLCTHTLKNDGNLIELRQQIDALFSGLNIVA